MHSIAPTPCSHPHPSTRLSPLPPPAYLQEEFVAAFQHLATKAMAMSSRRLGRPSSLLEFFVYDYGPDTAVCRWVYSRLGQGPVDEQVRKGGRVGRVAGGGSSVDVVLLTDGTRGNSATRSSFPSYIPPLFPSLFPVPLSPPSPTQALEASLDDFFQEPIEDVKGNNVRWISITGLEPSVVVRLANRCVRAERSRGDDRQTDIREGGH